MCLLQGFQLVSWETQGYGRDGLQDHRLRNFYRVNAEAIWLFQLIGCLGIFSLIWVRVTESGEQGSPETA